MIILCTIASIFAALCVANNRALMANAIWAVTNLGFILHSRFAGDNELTMLFIAYEIIAVYGVWNILHANQTSNK